MKHVLPALCLAAAISTAHAYVWGPVSSTDSGKHHYPVGIDVIRLNDWNNQAAGYGTESMWANSTSSWGAFATHADGIGHVKSYLSAWRGIRHGYDSADQTWWGGEPHNLGRPLSEISTLKVRWKFTAPNSGRHIALVDVFLDAEASPPSKNLVNLMIMPYLQDRTGHLSSPQARGTLVGSLTRDGVAYTVYYQSNKSWASHVYEVIPDSQTRDLTVDVLGIANWIRTNHTGTAVTSSLRVSSLWTGWETIEVLSSSNAFTTSAYSVNYKLNTSATYYTESLPSGWTSVSSGATVDFGSTTRRQAGSRSIQVAYSSTSGVLSVQSNVKQPTAGYTTLEFWAHPDGSSARSIKVWTSTQNSGGDSTVVTREIPASVWTRIRIPLSDLGNPTSVKRVNFGNNTGSANARIYIDNIRLIP